MAPGPDPIRSRTPVESLGGGGGGGWIPGNKRKRSQVRGSRCFRFGFRVRAPRVKSIRLGLKAAGFRVPCRVPGF